MTGPEQRLTPVIVRVQASQKRLTLRRVRDAAREAPMTSSLHLPTMSRRSLLGGIAASAALVTLHPFAARASGNQAHLRLMETTDIHVNVMPYDYYADKPNDTMGLARTASLIDAIRAEAGNSMLIDNGDFLQGNPMGDYMAYQKGMKPGDVHPVIKAMNALGYDCGTLGNHEFNYGLPFLNQVLGGGLEVDGVDPSKKCAGSGYPAVLANVYSNKTKKPLVQPYTVLERTLTARGSDGKEVKLPIKIGVIGFTTPGIMNWDKRYLEGKVTTEGAVEAATKYVPEL
eukprot:gene36447-41246_t